MSARILVVDDEKPVRELLRYKLLTAGFDVITAKNEKEFWQNAFTKKPDLIILDIWLKDRFGTDVYNNLLECGFDARVPVLFITALVSGHPKVRPAASEVMDKRYPLYSKPFDFAKLLTEIRCLLGQEERDESWDMSLNDILKTV